MRMIRRRMASKCSWYFPKKTFTTKVTTSKGKGCWAYTLFTPEHRNEQRRTQVNIQRHWYKHRHGQSPGEQSSRERARWQRGWWSWGSSGLPRRRRWRKVGSCVARCIGSATCSGGQICEHTCQDDDHDQIYAEIFGVAELMIVPVVVIMMITVLVYFDLFEV